jgi:hypothetical protein
MIKLSDKAKNIKRRLKNLPKIVGDKLKSTAKTWAYMVVKEFKDGINKGSFKLEPLKDGTIVRKKAMGYPKPSRPLYGLGEGDRSYQNCLIVVQRGKAFSVEPSKKYHHSAKNKGKKVKLDLLFKVHEYGARIKNAFGKGIVVTIPPRPARRLAYEKVLLKLAKREVPAARKEILNYVKKGTPMSGDK